jgi:superfamily II DNA or RNA helicase
VDRELVPLFLAERSTARVCKLLNDRLSGLGVPGTIHPNRVHALLSDDVSRGVNETTLALVEQASADLHKNGTGWQERAQRNAAQLSAEVEFLRDKNGLDNKAIKKRLSLPPAVARHLLSAAHAALPAASALPAAKKSAAPDWGFQDVAVAYTLEAFRQRPTSKVGLVLPTGAGKTRTALRIVLEFLAKNPTDTAKVYWVTHRTNLRTQAHRELQKLLTAGKGQVPDNAASLLANRIEFVMVGALSEIFDPKAEPPALVVVDEAHHAAAPSYQAIFDAEQPVPALCLTATPNRMDSLPIGIDEIAYTITYRELEDRGVIMMPEFLDFPVENFEWSAEQVRDLADYVVDRCADEFTKVLVLAPRIDRVEEFHDVLADALSREPDHPLNLDDLGYVHGKGNSLHIDNDDFLAIFAEKPRAILVSAQILLEGFDDPAINTVILTYPSKSVIRLMQAAGRCVRYFPGKATAYVVQARNDDLAYHFDQRWLYQEISDYLRPELIDIDYGSETDLTHQVATLLGKHNVKNAAVTRILEQVQAIGPGQTCRILLSGLPYYGALEKFEEQAEWGAFLETPENSAAFRGVFNAFSALGAHLSDPTEFLARAGARHGIKKDLSAGSAWRSMMHILTSCYFAREELFGTLDMARQARPTKTPHGPTTWLRYVAFTFRPQIGTELTAFLADCYNREAVIAAYLDHPGSHAMAIKLPLPLAGHEAWLLSQNQLMAFEGCLAALRDLLSNTPPADRFGALAGYLAGADHSELPTRILLRAEAFLATEAYETRTFALSLNQTP